MINGFGSTRQDVGNEVVPDPFDDIWNAVVCFVVQGVGVGEDAPFLLQVSVT